MTIVTVSAKFPVSLVSNPEATEFAILLGKDIGDYDLMLPIEAQSLEEAREITDHMVQSLQAWVGRILQLAMVEDVIEDDSNGRPIPGAGYVH